jgi:hypothetical protein
MPFPSDDPDAYYKDMLLARKIPCIYEKDDTLNIGSTMDNRFWRTEDSRIEEGRRMEKQRKAWTDETIR